MKACVRKSDGVVMAFHIEGIFGMDYYVASPGDYDVVDASDHSGLFKPNHDTKRENGVIVENPKTPPVDKIALLEAEIIAIKAKQTEQDAAIDVLQKP